MGAGHNENGMGFLVSDRGGINIVKGIHGIEISHVEQERTVVLRLWLLYTTEA